MATVNWINDGNGTWETGSDWSTGSVPGAGDDVTIGVAGTYTVTVEDPELARSLTMSNPTASLDLGANLTLGEGLSDSESAIEITAGTLAVTAGAVVFGVNGHNYGGPTLAGPGMLTTAAAVTTTVENEVDPNNGPTTALTLSGGLTWTNSGTVDDTGQIHIGSGSDPMATIVNNGIFEFQAPQAGISDDAGATGTFINAGTIDVGSNNGTSTNFSALLTNTGTIDLQPGTLNLQANSSISGTVTGSGTLEFSGGNSTITAATSGNLLVSGGDLTLAETSPISGSVVETAGGLNISTSQTLTNSFADSSGRVSLAEGGTLSLTGSLTGSTVTFAENGNNKTGATIDGPGTLLTGKMVTTTVDNENDPNNGPGTALTLGGGATWSNSGTVADTGRIVLGGSTIINNSGGLFQFETPEAGISDSTGTTGTFINAGTIDVGSNNGTSTNFSALLTNTGTIDLQPGTLNLQANSSIGGTVTGDGTLEFSGGEGTITAATSANLLVTGSAVLTLDEKSTISGNLTTTGGTVLLEKNVGLSGVVLDQGGVIDLDGNKLTGAAVTLGSSGMLEGHGTVAAPIVNAGTVTAEKGLLELGNGASGNGVFDLSGASKLEFLGSATGVNISFLSGGAETLLLAKPGMVHGTISGFSATDTIDLVKTAATGLSYANGTLTVTGSTGTLAVLNFNGQYAQTNFGLQSDGKGGTNIFYEPTSAGTHALLPDFQLKTGAQETAATSRLAQATRPEGAVHALSIPGAEEHLSAASLLGQHMQFHQ